LTELVDLVDVSPWTSPGAWDVDDEVSTITIADVDGETARARPRLASPGHLTSSRTVLERDLLFARIRPALDQGKVAIAEGLRNGVGLASPELFVLRPKAGVRAEWVLAFLRRTMVREHLAARAVGTTRPRVRRADLESLVIPDPPPDAVLARQLAVQRDVDALAVLAARGRSQVRELAPAIAQEAGMAEPRVPLSQLARVEQGLMGGADPEVGEGTVAYIDGRTVTSWLTDRDEPPSRRVRPPAAEHLLRRGDLLLPAVQRASRAGHGVLWTRDDGATIHRTLLRVRPPDLQTGAFLWAWLQTDEAQATLRRGGVTMRDDVRVTPSALRDLPVPELPPNVLHRHGAAVEAAMALEAIAAREIEHVRSLRQAHLAEMFPVAPGGGVVPRHGPAAQPAARGLDAIRARLSARQRMLWNAVMRQEGAFTLDDLVTGAIAVEDARRAVRLFERLGVVVVEIEDDVATLRRFDPEVDE
jgi:hypothetical protein